MSFELLCATVIALLFGLFVCFGGYRFFLVLLPIWGFFFGFGLGAQTIQALLGEAFLGSITSWVAGFFTGLVFAVLSYLFYIVAVAIIAGSLGYGLGVALMGAIGLDLNFLTWLVGMAAGIGLAAVTLYFNVQKYVIVIATAVGGAAIIVGTLMVGADGIEAAKLVENPIRTLLSGSPIWAIVFLVMAILGILGQWRVNQAYTVEAYENRI